MLNYIIYIITFFLYLIVGFFYIPTEESVLLIAFFILLIYINYNYGSDISNYFYNSIDSIKQKFIFLINIKQEYLKLLIFLYNKIVNIIKLINKLVLLLKKKINLLIFYENKSILFLINKNIKYKLKELLEVEKFFIKKIQSNFLNNLYSKSLSLSTKYKLNLYSNKLKNESDFLLINLNRLNILTKNNSRILMKKKNNKKPNIFIN